MASLLIRQNLYILVNKMYLIYQKMSLAKCQTHFLKERVIYIIDTFVSII